MAEQPNELRGIENSWSLLAFARLKGLPHPNTSKNIKTGEEFKNLVFVDKDNNRTFVAFSNKLGVLSREEIMARKDELQVIKLNKDPKTGKEGGYQLCKAGNLNMDEEINLFA